MTKLNENIEIGNTSKKLKDIIDVYSTSETKTNKKWINGKDIYRIVKEFSRSNSNQFNITAPSNVDTYTFIYGYVKGTNNLKHGLYFATEADQFRYYIQANNNITIIVGGSFPTAPFTGYFVIEYTKTN